MSRIKVDRGRCRALGVCESHAPAYFEVNDDGVQELLQEEIAPEDRRSIERAVEHCPTQSLSILED